MKLIFTRIPYFTFLFLLILLIDVCVKILLPPFPYRYISKPMIIILLLVFYVYNHNEAGRKKFKYVIIGLCSFLIGDILLITHSNMYLFIGGMMLFMIGKIFYSLKFSHTTDFNLMRLVPFLLVIFAFMATLFSFIYDNLDEFFIPVLFYFFVSLLTLQVAFLRKEAVNFLSYMLVLFGLELLVIGECVLALKMFYQDIPYQDVLTILLYGVSQYFIILGIIKEKSTAIPVNK